MALLKIDNETLIHSLGRVSRIVSLVPSLTETIAYFGGEEILVGVTRFCKYPEHIRQQTTVVGGPKDFNVRAIQSLKPDLIVGVKEENEKSKILQLAETLPVLLFDIQHLSDAYRMIVLLGKLFNAGAKAIKLVDAVQNRFDTLRQRPLKKSCIYLIWNNPWMAAGQHTFINEMLDIAGFRNLVPGRYPTIDASYFLQAEAILLSSEPYPFKETHRKQLAQQYPDKQVLLVDGEMFSWYGVRMLHAATFFERNFYENTE